jgi:hypothetical protein
MDSREYMRPDGHCKVCGWFHCRCAPAEVVECAGPFVSAFDCPVCDPRKRPIGPTSAVEAAAPGGEMTWQSAAQRLGEELASSGPAGYYSMTPEQWLAWSLAALRPVPAPGGDALREAAQAVVQWAEYQAVDAVYAVLPRDFNALDAALRAPAPQDTEGR